jgi:lipopolysaccharide export system protein LptA
LNGAAAIVNMKTGVATMTEAPDRRVHGLIVPNGSGGGSQASGTAPSKEAPK